MNNSKLNFFSFLLFVSSFNIVALADDDVERKKASENCLSITTDSLVSYASSFLGTPYKQMEMGKEGFDIPSFPRYIYARFGYYLPKTCAEQWEASEKVSLNEIRMGDLIFFSLTEKEKNEPAFVGIITKVDGAQIYFIHTGIGTGVRQDHTEYTFYKNRLMGVRRVLS